MKDEGDSIYGTNSYTLKNIKKIKILKNVDRMNQLKKYVASMSYGRRCYAQVEYFIEVFEIGTVIRKTSTDKS